jgi:hypothetical protein
VRKVLVWHDLAVFYKLCDGRIDLVQLALALAVNRLGEV